MKNRKKAFVALAVGAMLAGTTGTTLALWQDSGSINASPITTGELGVSFDRPNGVEITWDSVGSLAPGSTRIGKARLNTAFSGTNLTGSLSLQHGFPAGVNSFGSLTVTARYQLPNETTWHNWTGFPSQPAVITNSGRPPAYVVLEFTVTTPSPQSSGSQPLGTVRAVLEQTRGGN